MNKMIMIADINEKQKYDAAEMVVVTFGTESVITSSNDGEWDED